MYAEVLTELKAKSLDRTFTYKIPERLKEDVQIGSRVLIPFGNQKLEGFVLKIHNFFNEEYEVKEILSCQDDHPILNEELLKIGKYIQKKTLSTQIQSYQTMFPSALKAKTNYQVSKKYITYIRLKEPYEIALAGIKSKQGKHLLSILSSKEKIKKSDLASISSSALQTLLKKQIVEEEKVESYRLVDSIILHENKPKLTEEQENVYHQVMEEKGFKPFLLHGVTGSGKTEVYMALIESILKEGKKALVLVPEISLTPQFIEKFQNRFGNQIAVLHSKLSAGEKYDEWRKIESQEVSIVIGARSAIFAPLTNIGIIILDEEHSSSYKQENSPRYHAIDIALWRGKYHRAKVILGSATPSIQSYTRAQMGIYTLLEMKYRIHTSLPEVYLVNMKDEIRKGNELFSALSLDKIKEKFTKKEQVMILLNKRGYARVVMCHLCGYTDKCPHCDIPLTYHKASMTMRCHYCGYGKSILKKCPSCASLEIGMLGIGTQKVAEELQKHIPEARIIRMDADTTVKKNAYKKIVEDFKNKKYNILVGTQMIAKGLDFEDVTLVGVLCVDATLNIPDFRSGERTYELLNQVAGRAGRRNQKGEVIFQGFNMDHYSIQMASKHDYHNFYKQEMKIRKLLNYPPYYNIAVIEIRSKNEPLAQIESEKIKNFLKKEKGDFIILGPSPSLIPKKNDYYYFKIILKYKKKGEIMDKLIFIQNQYKQKKDLFVEIDLNPIAI